MIVPQFWAEARVHQVRTKEHRQVTVRRFGWSDANQAEAERMANERAQEAFKQIISGNKLVRREPKIAYNGADGVPIREEILSHHGETIITRNAYGAHCLNTPDVLFADVDFDEGIRMRVVLIVIGLLLASAIGLGVWRHSGAIAVFAGLAALVFGYSLAKTLRKIAVRLRGGPEQLARTRIGGFARQHPDWYLRLYRTPAGFRVLVMHRTFDAHEPAVADFFTALGVDPVYATMCKNQHCFRARVSPKPWRIGLGQHMRPRPGVWPVNPAQMEKRQTWIRQYEDVSAKFASCRFIEAIGGGTIHPKAASVRDLHDRMSLALSGREIA